MARFTTTVESAAALAVATTFANLVAGASANLRLVRVTAGFRNTGVVTDTNITLALYRATARGTATTTVAPNAEDPRSAASAITGLDTAWSVAPTVAATPLWRSPSLNTRGMADLPFEMPEEYICDQGTANGFAFQILGNALPAGYVLDLTLTHQE